MENFNWTTFSLKIAIKEKLSNIYNAWTQAQEIEKWFLSNAEFRDENGVLVPKSQSVLKGDKYSWTWYLYEAAEYGAIIEANGKDYFAFTFAGDCTVEIKLREEYEYTIVELTQSNIPTNEDAKKNIRLGCHQGWSFYLLNLKSVLEGGLDLRNKDSRFKPMVNN